MISGQTKELGELLQEVAHRGVGLVRGKAVDEVVFNSQKARSGTLFVALPGQNSDGHSFVKDAIRRGCSMLVVEEGRLAESFLKKSAKTTGINWIVVPDSRQALGIIAAAFFSHPAREMILTGITGTNGKTTTTYLLEGMLASSGAKTGVIGTINYRSIGIREKASLTTPEPVALQGLLRRMADKGVTHIIMEVSSHALSQKRISGLFFDVALFTNLSRDHLDFHVTMEEYFQSKKMLFTDHLKKDGTAVILTGKNMQHQKDWGKRLVENLPKNPSCSSSVGKVLDCGTDKEAIVLKRKKIAANGISAVINTPSGPWNIKSSLVGSFNLENLLGAVGVGVALGLDPQKATQGLGAVKKIPGRLEEVVNPCGARVYVDYAHTPDALEKALLVLKKLTSGRLVVVFGCGGDRDAGKRPLMGRVAGAIADIVLLTSDNPRSEEPGRILQQIEIGMKATSLSRHRVEWIFRQADRRGFDVIESRHDAIRLAIHNAGPQDVVLISGKGHEDYQITKNGRRFFDDRMETVKQYRIIQW